MKINTLGSLSDPSYGQENLTLSGYQPESLVIFLEKMILIRLVEEKIAELVKSKEVNCPCHLSVGQEAVAVGLSHHLNSQDRSFGNHRSHSHYLAVGGSVEKLIFEVFGKEEGCSRGMGGSMHLYAGDVGFHGSVPIVAGTIPLAVGAALAAKLQKRNVVSIAYFGDGACEEGVFHESLNLASVMRLPVLFVVENNLYSSHMDIFQRQPADSIARFAQAHHIETKVIDGNDVIAVEQAAKELIERARSGKGPGLLEAVTYRWLGHVGGNDDIDVGVRRSIKELEAWKKRDPIRRLMDPMISQGIYSLKQYEDFIEEKSRKLESIVSAAKKASWPEQNVLLDYVYSHSKGVEQ